MSATVWCWGTSDRFDLYYTTNAATPSWTALTTNQACTGGGVARTFTHTFNLGATAGTHAIRASFRYGGSAGACTSGSYNDRDDLVFELTGRDLAGFASRGQQRTAILAFKLAELDLLTGLDGRPPLLLLDDVFSELDPERRSHLVRRISSLPQAFVTTTTLADLDPALRAAATTWRVDPRSDGAVLVGPEATVP